MMNRIGLIPITAALTLIVGCSRSCDLRIESQGQSHARVRTYGDLRDLATALESYTAGLPTSQSANRVPIGHMDLNATPLFHMLSEEPVGAPSYLESTTSYHRWVNRGSLVDSWDSPLNHHCKRLKELKERGGKLIVIRITFWSNGPNRRNDGQHGDDIVGQPFEITLPEELVPADCQ